MGLLIIKIFMGVGLFDVLVIRFVERNYGIGFLFICNIEVFGYK